jgi:ribosomal protein S10
MGITRKLISMAKLYSQKAFSGPKRLPKKETVQFLLNYSKALKIVKTSRMNFELITN